jgi:hypothetical protein
MAVAKRGGERVRGVGMEVLTSCLSFSGRLILVSSFGGMSGGRSEVGLECGRHGNYCWIITSQC